VLPGDEELEDDLEHTFSELMVETGMRSSRSLEADILFVILSIIVTSALLQGSRTE
jgi:hypothetical protein